VADEERIPRCVVDLRCERVEAVHCLDALGEEPIDESEVAAGDADDDRDRGRVRNATVGHLG
jgi:hypothetical protein